MPQNGLWDLMGSAEPQQADSRLGRRPSEDLLPAADPTRPAIYAPDGQAEAAEQPGDNSQAAMPANMPAASHDTSTPPL
ncbi:hypothetical protein EV182_008688, partial [Spiromyces aspiralis]